MSMTPQILTVLASTSGVIGLLSLLGFFYYSLRVAELHRSERSIREIVEGDGLFNADQVLQILREFQTDEARLGALRTLTDYGNRSGQQADRVYAKIKGNVDLTELRNTSAGQYRILAVRSAVGFLSLAALAVIYSVWIPGPPVIATHGDAFEIFHHDRVVDLAGWREVPPALAEKEKASKTVWHDRFKIKRTTLEAKQFVVRRAVTGTIEPEFSSSTHRIEAKPSKERPLEGPRPIDRLYDVVIDVSNEPVNEWFDIALDAVYWNVFLDPTSRWVAIPVQFRTDSIRFELQSPNKPFVAFQREAYDRSDASGVQLVNEPTAQRSDDGKTITWRIDAPRTNCAMTVAAARASASHPPGSGLSAHPSPLSLPPSLSRWVLVLRANASAKAGLEEHLDGVVIEVPAHW